MTAYFYTYNVIFDTPVSGNAKLVYAYLCKCADADGKSYPAHKAISAAAGIGVTTVKKVLTELENAGLITVQEQSRPDRGRRANIYTIIKEKVNGFFLTYSNIFTGTLTAKARLVYLYFCCLASGRDQAFPAHKTTAKACGLSVAGARAAIDELEAAGLIVRQAQYRGNGGQKSNLYTINIEPQNNGGDNGDMTPKEPDAETLHSPDDSGMEETKAMAMYTEATHEQSENADYLYSNGFSLISKKSNRTENVTITPNPCENIFVISSEYVAIPTSFLPKYG